MMTTSPTLETLLTAHGDRLYGLCVRLDPDPDDAYGAVCERLLKVLPQFDPTRGSLGGWSIAVAHRLLVDRHRRRRTVVPLSGREAARELGADRIVERKERAARLDAALAVLEPEHRRVVVLHHLHGMSISDIARGEQIKEGTVKSRLHRGRAHLAVLLQETS